MKKHVIAAFVIIVICLLAGCGKAATSDMKSTEKKVTDSVAETNKDPDEKSSLPKEQKEDAGDVKTKTVEGEAKQNAAKEQTAEKNSASTEQPLSAPKASSKSSPAPPKPSTPAAAAQPSKPAHTHTWVAVTIEQPVYETQPVYENQPVYEWIAVCNGCGAVDPSREHLKQHVLNGENGSTSTKTVQTGTQKVQVGTKQVQTGTKTVVTGYKCSGCGAMQ